MRLTALTADHIVGLIYLAILKSDQQPKPILSDETQDYKVIVKADFDEFFKQAKIRMYHSKIIFEDALQAFIKAI